MAGFEVTFAVATNPEQLKVNREQPAIGLFAELGRQTVTTMEEVFNVSGTRGCETPGEVVLVSLLRGVGEVKSHIAAEAIATAIDKLIRGRSAMALEQVNREVYLLLKEGIKVSLPDKEHGGQNTERVRVMDWEHSTDNDFLLVSRDPNNPHG
jgi:type I restriction enzyme, R subunit